MDDGGIVDEDVQRPERLAALERAIPIALLAHVHLQERRSAPELLREGLARILEHVAEHDLRPVLHEEPHRRLAESAGTASDQGHLA